MSMLPYYPSAAKAREVLSLSHYGAPGSKLREQHHVVESTIAGTETKAWMIVFVPTKGKKR